MIIIAVSFILVSGVLIKTHLNNKKELDVIDKLSKLSVEQIDSITNLVKETNNKDAFINIDFN